MPWILPELLLAAERHLRQPPGQPLRLDSPVRLARHGFSRTRCLARTSMRRGHHPSCKLGRMIRTLNRIRQSLFRLSIGDSRQFRPSAFGKVRGKK